MTPTQAPHSDHTNGSLQNSDGRPGPFELNFENYKRQVLLFTRANLKTRYRKTWAGFLWVVMSPLIIFGVQALIFSHVLKIPIENYTLFLMSGLLPWIFIVQTSEMCAPLIVNSATLMKAFPISPLVFISAQVLDNLLNFIAALLLVLSTLLFFGSPLSYGVVLLLIAIPILLLSAAAIGLSLAILQVFFHDLKFVIGFLFSILYFATPIFYPTSALPEHLRWIGDYNPLMKVIAPFRRCLYDFDLKLFTQELGIAALITLLFAAIAYKVWEKKRHELYFRL